MSEELFDWPLEAAWSGHAEDTAWHDLWANRVLDFHGDPLKAKLTLFSDGNHHMALAECLGQFLAQHPELEDIFYLTLPPPALHPLLHSGAIRLGNLRLSLQPRLMIGPPESLAPLQAEGRLGEAPAFARSRGNVLLVRKANPCKVQGVEDLLREDLRVFISHPISERASHEVYRETLCRIAQDQGLDVQALATRLSTASANTLHGRRVHHREAPAAIAAGQADVLPIYYHLALRYTRVFPEHFDWIALPGLDEADNPQQVITTYHAALVDGGDAGARALQSYLCGPQAARIYEAHGLLRAED